MISGIRWTEHATAIAGVIAATTNNNMGIAGIDWNSQLLAKDAGPENEDEPTPEGVYSAVIDLADNEYKVANHSYGAPDYNSTLALAFAHSYNQDVVTVAAMGNGGYTPQYPAAFPGVIAVASVLRNGQSASMSSRGWHVDLAAPSANEDMDNQDKILTLFPNNEYGFAWGTSMAAPQVTGVVSLLRAWKPELSNDDVEWVLKLSARPLQGQIVIPDSVVGYGLMRADSAFALLSLPYTLTQSSVVGGSVVSTSDLEYVFFPPIPYRGRFSEVRTEVTFPKQFYRFVGAWARGSKSIGYTPANPNYRMRYAEFIPGTLTANGGTLRTYIWDLYSVDGNDHYGYFPTDPSSVVFAYSVLGEELLVAPEWISGADTLEGMLELSWPDTLTNETAWHVDRRIPSADWVNDYALLPAASTYFADSNLLGSAQHYYRVRPSNANQSPAAAGQLQFETTRPNTPRNTQAAVIMRRYDEYTPTAVEGSGLMPETESEGKAEYSYTSNSVASPADAGGGGGGPIWRPTNAIRLTFEEPLNQAVVPTSYIVRAWPEGVYCGGPLNPCPQPPSGDTTTINSPQPAYEWYEFPTAGAFNVCLARKNWQYHVGVYAVGFDGQWSLITPIISVTTGNDNFYDCDGGVIPQASVVRQVSGSAAASVDQNYPNPFNAATIIRFQVAEPGHASLIIYNVLGQRVRTLVDESVPGGIHEVTWDGRDDGGRDVASGVYLYRLQSDTFTETRRMAVVR